MPITGRLYSVQQIASGVCRASVKRFTTSSRLPPIDWAMSSAAQTPADTKRARGTAPPACAVVSGQSPPHFVCTGCFILLFALAGAACPCSSCARYAFSRPSTEERSSVVLIASLLLEIPELSLVPRESRPDRRSFFGRHSFCGFVVCGAASRYSIRSKTRLARSTSAAGITRSI